MMLSEMIEKLQKLHDKVGDVEVAITDGIDQVSYQGNGENDYEIELFEWRGQTFVDIGIGGCQLEVD